MQVRPAGFEPTTCGLGNRRTGDVSVVAWRAYAVAHIVLHRALHRQIGHLSRPARLGAAHVDATIASLNQGEEME